MGLFSECASSNRILIFILFIGIIILLQLVKGISSSTMIPIETETIEFECPDKFGHYPDPDDCSLYYICDHSKAELHQCNKGLHYSTALQTCDWPRNVNCAKGKRVESLVRNPNTEVYESPDDNYLPEDNPTPKSLPLILTPQSSPRSSLRSSPPLSSVTRFKIQEPKVRTSIPIAPRQNLYSTFIITEEPQNATIPSPIFDDYYDDYGSDYDYTSPRSTPISSTVVSRRPSPSSSLVNAPVDDYDTNTYNSQTQPPSVTTNSIGRRMGWLPNDYDNNDMDQFHWSMGDAERWSLEKPRVPNEAFIKMKDFKNINSDDDEDDEEYHDVLYDDEPQPDDETEEPPKTPPPKYAPINARKPIPIPKPQPLPQSSPRTSPRTELRAEPRTEQILPNLSPRFLKSPKVPASSVSIAPRPPQSPPVPFRRSPQYVTPLPRLGPIPVPVQIIPVSRSIDSSERPQPVPKRKNIPIPFARIPPQIPSSESPINVNRLSDNPSVPLSSMKSERVGNGDIIRKKQIPKNIENIENIETPKKVKSSPRSRTSLPTSSYSPSPSASGNPLPSIALTQNPKVIKIKKNLSELNNDNNKQLIIIPPSIRSIIPSGAIPIRVQRYPISSSTPSGAKPIRVQKFPISLPTPAGAIPIRVQKYPISGSAPSGAIPIRVVKHPIQAISGPTPSVYQLIKDYRHDLPDYVLKDKLSAKAESDDVIVDDYVDNNKPDYISKDSDLGDNSQPNFRNQAVHRYINTDVIVKQAKKKQSNHKAQETAITPSTVQLPSSSTSEASIPSSVTKKPLIIKIKKIKQKNSLGLDYLSPFQRINKDEIIELPTPIPNPSSGLLPNQRTSNDKRVKKIRIKAASSGDNNKEIVKQFDDYDGPIVIRKKVIKGTTIDDDELLHTSPAIAYEKAAKCNDQVCRLPNCRCGSSSIPGGIEAKKIPQIVMLTFDDSVNDLNRDIYDDIFNSGRTNPNGCPILGTFYVSHEWTDYGQVQTLYSRGHEMASHSITHSFGDKKWSKNMWHKEIAGQKEILHLYGGVKLEDIRGMRAPFLQTGGNTMFEMLHESNFTYDSSLPVYDISPPYWPYTLDYAINHECMITPCPTKSFPGFWEVGMVMWEDLRGGRCSMADACFNPKDDAGVYQLLKNNFDRHYSSNRAPFGIYFHSRWFLTEHNRRGFTQFLDEIMSHGDVFLTTNWQMIQWIKNPTPMDRINSFAPWQCNDDNTRVEACERPHECKVKLNGGEMRNLRTCQQCPKTYPWVGNNGISKSKVNNS